MSKSIRKKFWICPSLALLGFENFILAKNCSQDLLFFVTSFSSILDPSSEYSTGHVFHFFKLKIYVVTSCVLLSEEKIKIKKSQRISKINDNQKIEKIKRGKSGTISRGAHRDGLSEQC
jgi:hypothetical protein